MQDRRTLSNPKRPVRSASHSPVQLQNFRSSDPETAALGWPIAPIHRLCSRRHHAAERMPGTQVRGVGGKLRSYPESVADRSCLVSCFVPSRSKKGLFLRFVLSPRGITLRQVSSHLCAHLLARVSIAAAPAIDAAGSSQRKNLPYSHVHETDEEWL